MVTTRERNKHVVVTPSPVVDTAVIRKSSRERKSVPACVTEVVLRPIKGGKKTKAKAAKVCQKRKKGIICEWCHPPSVCGR